MKVAIIGGGISGNTAAWLLNEQHDITLFEANDYLGGHTHTHQFELEGREVSIDSGFIVYNDWTYPNFVKLLNKLGVATQPTTMGFSVRCDQSGLEYAGTDLGTLFSQKRNLLSPGFLWMLREILRFNKYAPGLINDEEGELPLGDFLSRYGYSERFIRHYLVPMGSAIWSTKPDLMLEFPAKFFVRFCQNHGLLSINDRPQWRVIAGGSASYLEAMTRDYKERIRLSAGVAAVRRFPHSVRIKTQDGIAHWFDAVFFACHSDQALELLEDASKQETEVLGALPYQPNTAVLHTDTRWLPRNRKAWSAWNYHLSCTRELPVSLTYNMNILQSLDLDQQVLVTMNPTTPVDEKLILGVYEYDHPLFTPGGIDAQHRWGEINGQQRSWFCGAYWRNGFHEDGVVSAMNAVEHFKRGSHDQQQNLRRAG